MNPVQSSPWRYKEPCSILPLEIKRTLFNPPPGDIKNPVQSSPWRYKEPCSILS